MPSTLDADSPFHEWFQKELADRRWTIADLAREAEKRLGIKVHPTGIGQIARREKRMGIKSAQYIAAGFGISDDVVLELGGLKSPTSRRRREHSYLLSIFDDLSEEAQEQLIAQAKFLRSQESKKTHETQKGNKQNPLRPNSATA